MLRHLAQVRDGLAAEQSAKVAQKDEQCGRVAQLVAQHPRLEVDTLDGLPEDGGWNGSSNGLSHMNVL